MYVYIFDDWLEKWEFQSFLLEYWNGSVITNQIQLSFSVKHLNISIRIIAIMNIPDIQYVMTY